MILYMAIVIMKGTFVNKDQMNYILKSLDYKHYNVRSVTGPTKQISPVRRNALVETTRRYDKERNVIHLNGVCYKEFFKKYATEEKCIVMPFFEQISPSEYKYNGMYKFLNYDDEIVDSLVELEHVHDLIF